MVILSAVIAASLTSFLFVHYYGVDVPFSDDWEMLPTAQFFMEKGTVPYTIFLVQNNENFHLFPKLITAAAAIATGYNMKSIMYLSLACFISIIAIISLMFRRRESGVMSSLSFVPVPFLLLSFIQYENLLWGMQLTLMLAESLAVIVIFLLCRERLGRAAFFWAVVCAAMAPFSYSHGNLIWPIGFVLLLVNPSSTRLQKRVWIALWMLVWGTTAIKFEYPQPFGLSEPLKDPFRVISYFLESLGNSLGLAGRRHSTLNQLFGAIVAIVLMINLFELRRVVSPFWCALSTFSAATLMLISIGRCLVEDILPSRSSYMTHGLLITSLAFITTLFRLRSQKSLMIRAAVPCALAVALSVCVAAGDVRGIKGASERMVMLKEYQFILSEYETYPDSYLAKLHPKAWVIRERAPFLQRNGYSVFKDHSRRARDLSLVATAAIKGTFKTSDIIVEDIEDHFSISAYLDDEITFDPEKAYVEIRGRLFRAHVCAGERLLRRTVWKGVLREGMNAVKIVLLVGGARYESESSVVREVINIPAAARLFSDKRYDGFSTLYDIDYINFSPSHLDTVTQVGDQCYLYVRGWAVDSKWRSRAGGVFVKIDDRLFETRFGLARPDIVKAFRYYKYKHSGFEVCIPLDDIPPGIHKLGIVVVGADPARYYYQPTKDISVALPDIRDHPVRAVTSGLNYIKEPTRYVIDSINGSRLDPDVVNVISGGRFVVRGWAIDKLAGLAPGGVYVAAGDVVVEAKTIERPDVAQTLANDRFLNCSFEAVFPAGAIGLGEHSLSLIVVTADKKGYYLLDEQSYYHSYGPWIKISVER